jgi:hypothetical protein
MLNGYAQQPQTFQISFWRNRHRPYIAYRLTGKFYVYMHRSKQQG